MYECSLCGATLGENPLIYWCSRCYRDWKEAIRSKESWTVFLANLERRRRYREKDEIKMGIVYIHIGDRFDIAMIDGKAEIVPTKEFYDGEN